MVGTGTAPIDGLTTSIGRFEPRESKPVTLGEMKAWLTDPTSGVPYEARRLYGVNRERMPQVWGSAGHVMMLRAPRTPP